MTAMNWVGSGSGYTARSPDDLMLALSRIGTLNRFRRFVWRGAADRRWRLAPSLIRELATKAGGAVPSELDVRRRELVSIREARTWGLGRELGDLATDLHMLALLQHHGVHTRLLDVTPNPMTALGLPVSPRPALTWLVRCSRLTSQTRRPIQRSPTALLGDQLSSPMAGRCDQRRRNLRSTMDRFWCRRRYRTTGCAPRRACSSPRRSHLVRASPALTGSLSPR